MTPSRSSSAGVDLLPDEEKCDRQKAVKALRERLNPGGKALAAQDFRHTAQKGNESVADYIRRLEHMFHIAYGERPAFCGDKKHNATWQTTGWT